MPLTMEQKILCAISHLGILVGFPILAPLLVYFLSKDDFVKLQAKEALFFQILVVILMIISLFLTIFLKGLPLFLATATFSIFFPIMAVVRLCKGRNFSYPFTGKFVRKG